MDEDVYCSDLAVGGGGGYARHAANHHHHRGCQHHREAKTRRHPADLGAHCLDDPAAAANHAQGDPYPAPEEHPVQWRRGRVVYGSLGGGGVVSW